MIDKRVFYIGMSAGLVLVTCLAVQGCDLQKMVKVDVPQGVQQSVPVGEEVPLSESEYAWDQWSNWVEANSEAVDQVASETIGNCTAVTAIAMIKEVDNFLSMITHLHPF